MSPFRALVERDPALMLPILAIDFGRKEAAKYPIGWEGGTAFFGTQPAVSSGISHRRSRPVLAEIVQLGKRPAPVASRARPPLNGHVMRLIQLAATARC